MKVLVTGSEGFIGSHLTQKLLSEGHHVKALVQYNSFGKHGWLDTFKHDAEIIIGDVRDSFQINQICKDVNAVYHLAALISIPYSYTAPQSYIDTNVTGTLNILEACKNKRLMITSTSEVYGSAQYTPMDEKHPKSPQSPYAASKVAADALALSYHKSFGTPVTIVRPFNTYGPRQSMRAVIPQIIMQSLKSDTITLGNTKSTRDFNYVEDTVSQMIKVMQCDILIGKEVNICTGIETSIEDICTLIGVKYIVDKSRLRPEASEVDRLVGGGTGKYNGSNLKKNIKKTIEWFKENNHLYKEGYVV